MNDSNEYFNAPAFEGLKTAHACRYQSEFELRLMHQFEATAKVKSYKQPSILALVKNLGVRRYINVDFWIEYQNGRVDLIYIEKLRSFIIGERANIFILDNDNELTGSFGFVVVNEGSGNFRRIRSENLNLGFGSVTYNLCFVNFTWIN